MIIFVVIIYYFFGRLLTKVLFTKELKEKYVLYNKAFLISLFFVLVYHYMSIFFGWTHSSYPGLYWEDDVIYHKQAILLAKNSLIWDYSFHGDQAFSWQYIIGINYFVFGVDTIIPKIFNVTAFSLGLVTLYLIVFNHTSNKKVSKKAFNISLMFLPLLFYSATVTKETFLFFITFYCLYRFQFILQKGKTYNYTAFLISVLIMFLTRNQYALSLFSLALFILILSYNISVIKRLLGVVLVIGLFLFFYNIPFIQQLKVINKIENSREGTKTLIVSRSNQDYIYVEGGYLDYISTFFSDPLPFSKRLFFGFASFAFSPPPTSIPSSIGKIKEIPQHFFASLYSLIFYFLLPSIYFGIKYRYKLKLINKFDIILISYFIVISLGIILNKGDFYRYRLSFIPILFVYSSIGFEYYPRWKKRLPEIIAFYVILLLSLKYIIRFGEAY